MGDHWLWDLSSPFLMEDSEAISSKLLDAGMEAIEERFEGDDPDGMEKESAIEVRVFVAPAAHPGAYHVFSREDKEWDWEPGEDDRLEDGWDKARPHYYETIHISPEKYKLLKEVEEKYLEMRVFLAKAFYYEYCRNEAKWTQATRESIKRQWEADAPQRSRERQKARIREQYESRGCAVPNGSESEEAPKTVCAPLKNRLKKKEEE